MLAHPNGEVVVADRNGLAKPAKAVKGENQRPTMASSRAIVQKKVRRAQRKAKKRPISSSQGRMVEYERKSKRRCLLLRS